MSPVEVAVTEARDPRLTAYTDLTDVSLRRVREPAEGIFLAEGEKVIRRAVAAGYPLQSVLMEPRWRDGLADVLAGFDGPVYLAGPELLRSVTGYRVHRGALACLGRLPLPSYEDVVSGSRRVVVLEDLVDHTNVGAVFRSAAALGMDAVLVSPRCADPLYRRAVKVSMGAVFSLPWTRVEPWPGGLDRLRDKGFHLLGMTPQPSAISLDELDPRLLKEPLALVFGTEGEGLSRSAVDRCDLRVRIPMAAGVDSLNAAAAAAVACYAVTRPTR
ncbi:MAG: RNA methyltransferase [Candidatus Nanopelagicales bacterium]